MRYQEFLGYESQNMLKKDIQSLPFTPYNNNGEPDTVLIPKMIEEILIDNIRKFKSVDLTVESLEFDSSKVSVYDNYNGVLDNKLITLSELGYYMLETSEDISLNKIQDLIFERLYRFEFIEEPRVSVVRKVDASMLDYFEVSIDFILVPKAGKTVLVITEVDAKVKGVEPTKTGGIKVQMEEPNDTFEKGLTLMSIDEPYRGTSNQYFTPIANMLSLPHKTGPMLTEIDRLLNIKLDEYGMVSKPSGSYRTEVNTLKYANFKVVVTPLAQSEGAYIESDDAATVREVLENFFMCELAQYLVTFEGMENLSFIDVKFGSVTYDDDMLNVANLVLQFHSNNPVDNTNHLKQQLLDNIIYSRDKYKEPEVWNDVVLFTTLIEGGKELRFAGYNPYTKKDKKILLVEIGNERNIYSTTIDGFYVRMVKAGYNS